MTVPVAELDQPDAAQLAGRALGGVGQPARVGGERQAGDVAVDGAVQLGDRAVAIQAEQPAVVAGQGKQPPVRGGCQLQHPAELAGCQPADRAGAAELDDLDRIGTLGIGQVGDRGADLGRIGRLGRAGQDHRLAVPDAGGAGQHPGRAVAVGQQDDAAAHLDHAGPAGPVHLEVTQLLCDADLGRRPTRARAGQLDLEPARLRVCGQAVQQPQLACLLVDQPAAVAGQLARVVLGVIGVPAQVAPVGTHRVDVAVALEVGQECQPVRQPGRIGLRAGQLGQELGELGGRRGGQPEPAGGAAAIPLPVGVVAQVAGADHHRPGRRVGYRVHRAVGQPLRARVGVGRRTGRWHRPSRRCETAGCRPSR